jgi:pimeloyl-ACP methyl ester carboxylesterase
MARSNLFGSFFLALTGAFLVLGALSTVAHAQPRVGGSPSGLGIDSGRLESSPAAISPDLYIESRELPPDVVDQGESFIVEVEATNQGDQADFGGVVFSFPELDQPGDGSAVELVSSSDDPNYEEYEPGETIFDREGNEISAEYLLVQLEGGWEANETKRLRLRVYPSEGQSFSTGIFETNWRVTASTSSGYDTFPSSIRSNDKDQQGWPVKQPFTEVQKPRATIDLRIENVDVEGASETVPGGNGEVALFDENGTQVKDPRRTDATGDGAGEVTFTDLDPTEDYRAEVYHDPDDSPFGAREYWASVPGIAVDPGETRDLTIVRSKPFVSLFRAVQGGEEVTGGSVTAGEEVTVEVQIQNPSDGETADVRPRVAVQNEQGEEVFDEKGDYERVAEGYKSTLYRFSWTPQEAGTYYRGYEVQIDEGGDQVTDSAPFKTRLVTAEELQKAEIKLRVENVDTEGASTTVPRDNGEVSLFGENGTPIVDREPTDAIDDGTGAGQVVFTGLEPSKSYEARVYHDNENSPLGITEYWGRKTGISVQSGKTAEVDFSREQPYFQDLKVLNSDGENVTTETVRAGTPLTVKMTVKNDGAAQEVTPRLVLDDNRDDSDGFLYDETRSAKVVAGDGGTKTFSFSWTPEETGDVYRTYVINGIVPDGNGGSESDPTGSGGWWDQPLVNVEGNKAPTVSVDEQTHPSSMYPGRTYTVTATYEDPNGASNLDHVDLLLDHPTDETIHLWKTTGGGSGVESGQKFLAPFNGPSIEKSEKKVVVDWTFTFKNDKSTDWAAVENREQGISFQVEATDDAGETATDESDVEASYRNYGTTVLAHGLQNAFSSTGDKLSRWLRDAACFVRQKAGRGKILVYDHRDGELKKMGHSDFQSDFYQYFDENICPEVGNSDDMINVDNSSGEGERIIVFDWTKDSMDPGLGYSEAAANALFALLKKHQKKRSLEPLHLIGHSRGTTVISEAAERLLATGNSVDHVTYLDPHDWGYNAGNLADSITQLEKLLDLAGGRTFHDLGANSFSVDRPDIPSEEEYAFTDPTSNSGTVTWSGVEWSEAYWQSNSKKDIQFDLAKKNNIENEKYESTYDEGNCYRYLEDRAENIPITEGVLKLLNGRPVLGSYNGNWSGLTETDSDGDQCDMNHSGIYREYIRTIESPDDVTSGYNFSRIGGYPAQRPKDEEYDPDFSENPRFTFDDVGSAIPNGNFERGKTPSGLSLINPFCSYEGGCIAGWNAHGGGGDARIKENALLLNENGNTRISDRFYVPESADKIFFTYEIADEGEDENDVLEASLDGGEGFEDEFGTAVTSGDRGSAGSISLDGKTGSVQRLRFQIGNPGTDGFNPDATVYVDNVQFITGENPPPFVANEPDDREVRRENGPVTVDLQNVFDDPDGESLQYGAPSSSNSSVATASEDGGTVTVSLESGGETTISLSAEDGAGQVAETSFTVRVIDTPLPDPAITEQADPPVAVQPGETFTMSVTATNEGGPATYGSISASFPAYDQPSDAERVKSDSPTSGDGESYVERSEGQTIFNSEDEEVEAKYLLTEYADDKWESGETNTLDLQVTAPSKEGQFTVYLRTTLSSGKEDVTVPGESSDAQTATDQQGYRVFEIPVQVTNDSGTPVVENPIADQTLLVTQESEFTKELDAVFSDPNGEDLSYEATVTSENSGREVVSVEIASGVLVVTPLSAGTATVEVTATDAAENSVTEDFTVTAENPAPTLTKLIPSRGEKGETLDLTVEGSGFVKEESTLEFSGSGISVNQRTVSSSSEIKATLSIASDASEGNREVVISNPTPGGGSSEPETFTVLEEAVAGPAVPTDLQASAGDSQVELSWSAGEGSSPVGYDLYRSTSPFGDTTEAGRVNPSLITGGAEYTDKSVSNGTEYVYRVVAVGEDGERSGASSAASATPTSGNEPPQVVINEGLSVEEGKTKTITTDELSASDQNDGAEALTFEVTGRPSRGDLFVDGAVAGSAGAPSFTQADLEGGDVEYRHTAENASDDRFTFEVTDGQVGTSEREFTIEIEPTSPLAPVPEEVSASSLPDRAVEISWKAGGEGGADQHYLYRLRSPIDSSAGPGGLVPHDTLEGSGESGAEAHVDTSVSLGKTYYYRLTATGEEREESGFSEEAVGIGYLAGDPSEDGRVNAADASLVLQDAVQKITFDKPQRRAGDVSGEGRANAGDASLILQHAVGLITQFPVEEESGAIAAATDAATDAATSAKTAEETSKSASMAPMDRVSGQLAWGQARPADQKEGTEVPVRLEGNAQNVRSVRLEGAFDPSTLEVLGAEPSAEGWQASSQISQGQGRFRVAMAGPESASSGQVAVLRVKVKEEAIEEAREPTLSADGVLNGAARRGLSAKTVRPVPSEIKLGRSAPNPAQGPVTIEYGLPEETRVQIEVYDVLGRKVTTLVEGSRPPGRHEVTLEGGRLPSGTYFYRMKADGRQKTRRLTVVQ